MQNFGVWGMKREGDKGRQGDKSKIKTESTQPILFLSKLRASIQRTSPVDILLSSCYVVVNIYIYIYIYIYKGLRILSRYCSCQDSETPSVDIDKLLSKNFFLWIQCPKIVYMFIYIYIYIYRERERERELCYLQQLNLLYINIYIYIYI